MHTPISEAEDRIYHHRLPMDRDEKILAVYKHHWFAYASVLFLAVFASTVVFGLVAILTAPSSQGTLTDYASAMVFGALAFAMAALLFALVLIWLRSQEKLVLSDEAVYQVLQPTLFAGKVSQLSLVHVADVTASRDFFGTIFGFGTINIETPGEQNNYVFKILGDPNNAVRAIVEAHEDFYASAQNGHYESNTLRSRPKPATGLVTDDDPQQHTQIDPQEYQDFLNYQEMKRAGQRSGQNQSTRTDDATLHKTNNV